MSQQDNSLSGVPLVEVINALREDLKEAQKQSDPNNPLIIEDIEIELQTVVTKEGTAKAKAKIEVLNVGKLLGLGGIDVKAGLKGKLAEVSTQKIKLKLSAQSLNPETNEFENTQISDEDEY